MKFVSITALLYLISVASAASLPQVHDLSERQPASDSQYLDPRDLSPLEKRKGGGGKGGSGGSGEGDGEGSGGSGTSSGSGGGSRSPGSYSFSSTQNTGGRTISGSGPAPAYGGRYAGGAAVPYTAGARSPTRGVLPYALPIAAIGFFPGLWLYGSLWAYPYGSPYYYNHNGRNTTANVTCLCQQYSECGCDDTGNSTLVQSIVNNGTDQPVNSTVSQFVTWPNGTSDAYINGTLPNGTTAPGGTDPSNTDEIPSGAARLMMNLGGYWIMVVTVGATVMAL